MIELLNDLLLRTFVLFVHLNHILIMLLFQHFNFKVFESNLLFTASDGALEAIHLIFQVGYFLLSVEYLLVK